jgi:single-stranded DNA-specific DHH superfamily exonuclease
MKEKIVKRTIKPAIEFIKGIGRKKVVIVHHEDSDGCCSGAILALLIKKLCGYIPKTFATEPNSGLTANVIKKVLKEKPDFIILTDIPHVPIKLLKELNKKGKILIIDHHPYEKYANAIYCNPIIYKSIYLPASYLAYRIYKHLTGLNDVCWMAGAGVIGDFGAKNCVDLLMEIKNRYYELIDEVDLDNKILFENSLLGDLAKIVESARIVKGRKGAEFVSKILTKNNFKEILDGSTKETKVLLGWNDSANKEFKRLVNNYNKNKKIIKKNVCFYEINSKYNIRSSVGAHLMKFLNKEILVIGQKNGRFLDLSLRKGKKIEVDLGHLIKELIKNIPESDGGGHTEAAAARIPAKFFDRFVRNLSSFDV